MIVVTSGKKYIEIDAYASCIAYAELLKLKGEKSKAVSYAKLNKSITKSLRNLNIGLDNYIPTIEDKYIVLDVSNKEYFDVFVNENNIIQLIDHHPGYEKYWKDNKSVNSIIEPIGAVATIIFEMYKKEKLLDKMKKDVGILLMSAILDNTLNLKAKITNKRDVLAYSELEKMFNIENYAEKYFNECQIEIENNLKQAIENDTKLEKINDIIPPIFAQLTIWSKETILNNIESIYDIMQNIGENWMMNLICLKDGKSYIIAKNKDVQRNLQTLFSGSSFTNNIMKLDNVWLRKEIIKFSIN